MDLATLNDIASNLLAFLDEVKRIVGEGEMLPEAHRSPVFQVEIGIPNYTHLASLVFVEC
jgi:hypothetical protein